MHLSRHLQFPEAQRDPEPEAFCGQVMASVRPQDIGESVLVVVIGLVDEQT